MEVAGEITPRDLEDAQPSEARRQTDEAPARLGAAGSREANYSTMATA